MNREARIRKINFWLRIREKIDARLSELHGASTKCPRCNVWSYQLPLDKQPQWSEGPPASMTDIRTCQHCGNVSQWFDTGFMGVMHCVEVDYKAQTPAIAGV